MNWLDMIIAVPLAWGLYKGLSKGLIMEIAGIVGLIVGVYLSVRFSVLLSDYLYSNTDINNDYLPVLSFAAIFIIAVLLVHLLAKVVEKLVKVVAMGWANKIAGALFGIFRTAFFLSVILLLLNRFGLTDQFERGAVVSSSFLYSPVRKLAPAILPMLNEIDQNSLIDKADRKVEKIKDRLKDAIP